MAGSSRRRYLAAASAFVAVGCVGSRSGEPADGGGGPRTLVVSPDGSDDAAGTRESPLRTLQAALDAAGPGDTIRLASGVHRGGGDREGLVARTTRAGEPGKPITITGPRDAVVRGDPVKGTNRPLLDVTHSHVHVTGATFDGLMEPDSPRTAAWYRPTVIGTKPPRDTDEYLTDVTLEPHAVGNSRRKILRTIRTNDLEIGGFEVVGPAGVDFLYGDAEGFTIGEVIGLGRSGNNVGTEWYPWTEPDQSHGIHVHHVANRAGHEHTELVKAEPGVYDLTVEYCTDAGGSGRRSGNGASVTLLGAQSTVRWCVIEGGSANGVSISPPLRKQADLFADVPDERFPGRNNAVYGNRFRDLAGVAVHFPEKKPLMPNGPSYQGPICGNEVAGSSAVGAGEPCPDDVPAGDGVGHTGGDNPWSDG